ncbi:zinc finger protein 623-like [Neolamprologus brichardi]|uniref:Si:ch73-109d9.3 n=1 Tax=Neolamprologus brichardi TaxID=32507 RepID=A0A3Q4HPB9_NEOBR|nr:zinc finger protein 623-like [Neolamprologus brichardi]
MSDLDTLIVTFQTQLSDVMEAVVKTAMFEVTRLVEDVFLVEVKRRSQEIESLRMQLQWIDSKFKDQAGKEGGKTGRGVHCARHGVELSTDTAEERSKNHQEEQVRGLSVKTESDSFERWTASCRLEDKSESLPEADSATAAQSPEREPEAAEEKDVRSAVATKEEEVSQPSCSSVHMGGWNCSDEEGPGSDNESGTVEVQPKQTEENSEELLRNVMKKDPQIAAGYGFPEDRQEKHLSTDRPRVSSLEIDTSWAGLTVTGAELLHNPRLGAETERDPVKTKAENELSDSVRADIQVTPGRDKSSSSGSPKARLKNSDVLGLTIKKEVILDSDGCEEGERIEKKITNSGMSSFSCSVKQHKVSSEAHRLNHISQKAAVQEVMKLHSKAGSGFRLQAALQHLHRPMKKPTHTLSNSTAAALSIAPSQVVNLNNLQRIPSTSKASPAVSSIQRVHLGDKQTSTLNRTGDSWVSNRSQHHPANSHHVSPGTHPDSQSHAAPRHLLRCGQCGKCFPHPSNLKAHLQTHTGERPFCCSLCGRSFTKLSNLKAHRRVHTGERPYCCLACGKRFTQKCNLKRHQRIHLDAC